MLALLVLLAVGSTTAAIWIAQAKGDADRSREAAEKAQQESAAHAQASGKHFNLALDTLMLLIDRVDKQLGATPGTLALRQQLLQAALKKLEEIATSAESTPQVDHNVVVAHDRLGDLFFTLGRTPEARKQFELAQSRAEQLVAARPGDVEASRDLAKAHDKLGDQLMLSFKFKEAEVHYRRAFDLREELEKSGAANEFTYRDRSISRNKLGDVCLATADFPKALGYYKEGLQFLQSIDLTNKEKELLLSDLRFSYGRLGDAAKNLGDYRGATDYYEKSLEYAEAVAKAGDASGQVQMAATYDRLGMAYQRLKENGRAEGWFRKSLQLRKTAADADPGNAEWRRNVAASLSLIGDARHWDGNLTGATESYLQGLAICEELAKRDPDSLQKQGDLVANYRNLANVAFREERYRDAADWLDKLLGCYRHTEGKDVRPERKLELAIYEPLLAAAKFAADRGLDDLGLIEGQKPVLALWLLRLRALSLARHGRHELAVATVERGRELQPQDGWNLFFVARCYGLCARAVVRLPQPPTREEDALELHYLELAVATMRESARLGPQTFDVLLNEPDLDFVYNQLGYDKFVQTLRGP